MSARKKLGSGADLKDVIREFEGAYESALKDLGRFNLAIFGKTGAGKSTLINAIFSDRVADVGAGRPVTLKTTYYEHPSGYFGVYDSEGIEVGEEGDKILERFRQIIAGKRAGELKDQIHVIWYCVRGGDLRFEDGQAEFVRRLADEGLPIIFVFTQVEKRDGQIHPKVQETAETVVERDLPIAPANQVFFTMAEGDEFSGLAAHGLEELLDATFRVAPDGVRNALTAAQKLDLSRKAAESRKWVQRAAVTAAGAGAAPIPFSDAAVLVPMQTAMMAKISVTFGLGVGKGTLATLAGAAITSGGLVNAGKYLATNLLKFVPGGNLAGGAIRAGVASSLTYAVGEAWIAVCGQLFKIGPVATQALSTNEIRDMFMVEFKKRAKRQQNTAA